MTERLTLYVPRDSGAISVGADDVARALADEAENRNIDLNIVRTGSRGLYWLEPLVEADSANGRIGFGPVDPGEAASLFESGFTPNSGHAKALGPVMEIPYLASQTRVTFERCGVIDPVSVEDYRAHGGFRGLENALAMAPEKIVEEMTESGLRGRGGAGFPTGIKWRTVMETPGDVKYVCCNADEGDSGTFADRMLMEGDPLALIEGMAIAAVAVNASKGLIYIRSEYPTAIEILEEALANVRKAGWLGRKIGGSRHDFDIELRIGAGAYICGEETSMLDSLEGKRGMVRYKPPLPAIQGAFSKPTVVNNVLSLAAAPTILDKGGAYYQSFGVEKSRGTQPFQLAGNIKYGGLVEVPFGISLRELIEGYGGGTRSGRPIRAVQVGGPLGSFLPEHQLDLTTDYEILAENEAMMGHGGIVVFDDTVDMAAQARFSMEFCAIESCGKCTPCRLGSVRGVEVIERIKEGVERDKNHALLKDLCQVMTEGSLCAMGGLTPMPVESALKYFPQDFGLPAEDAATN